ncbi:MAG: hypothetical protein KDD55_04075 [Bdellovibrionales bacterium]|nr:hypothetical protein [Bdellovibrionales bacterium]
MDPANAISVLRIEESSGVFLRLLLSSFVVFVIAFVTYLYSPVNANPDSEWTVFTAQSLLHEHNLSLNEYPQVRKRLGEYSLLEHNNRIYNYFPIGATLFTLPVVFLYEWTPRFFISYVPTFEQYRHRSKLPSVVRVRKQIEHLTASFLCALVVGLVFLWARVKLPLLPSLSIALTFAFGTSVWSVASQSMWQHGPSLLCLSLAFSCLLVAREKAPYAAYASIPLAMSFFVRPTNAIAIICISLFVLYAHREYFIRYLLFAIPFALLFFLYSLSVYDSFLPPYYAPSRVGESTHFVEAFFANLISPARGLFVYSPFYLFVFAAGVAIVKERRLAPLHVLLVSVIVLHLLCISSFPRWWAGHSFGPRLMIDILPFLSYFLIEYFLLFKEKESSAVLSRLSLFALLSVVAFAIHFKGAYNWNAHLWSSTPIDVDQHTERIWDWSDMSIFR